MVLILTAWGVVRFVAAFRWWDVLTEFGSRLSPLYLSITGAGWAVAGGALLVGILRRKKWALPFFISTMLIWLIEYWMERIFFQSTRSNLPFVLTVSIFVIAITWILAILPGTTSYFAGSETHEQSDEKPNSA